MKCRNVLIGALRAAMLGSLLAAADQVWGQSKTLLHTFAGLPTDGAGLSVELVQAANGNLYGITPTGGATNAGALFTVKPDGTGYAVLLSFSAALVNLTQTPANSGGLMAGPDGALYGVSTYGGANNLGYLFKIQPDGTGLTLLHTFGNTNSDGANPEGAPILGMDGFLYGTTNQDGGPNITGSIYKIRPDASGYAIIYNFGQFGSSAPQFPLSKLAQGPDGSLYGTTSSGGAARPSGGGVLFKVNPDGSGFTILHAFGGAGDAVGAKFPLVGSDGAIYGTVSGGGPNGTDSDGVVYRINPDGSNYQYIHVFTGNGVGNFSAGSQPQAGLIQASDGFLYGTAASTSGASSDNPGTIFRMKLDGTGFTVLYAFAGGADGSHPYAGLVQGSDGSFYGGTYQGGIGNLGTLFKLNLTTNVAPAFTTQPVPQTVVSGTTVVFNTSASGFPAPTFQWKLNGANVAGATSARLVVTAGAATTGTYTCVATNALGSATSTGAALTLTATTNVGRLINLSVNTTAGKSQVLTVGFVSGGSGTSGSENLLIRATGPALAGLGVPNTLADPTLSVLNGSTVLISNDNWGTPTSNQATVTAADSATFAFPLANPASLDAAVAQPFAAGADTVQVSGTTAGSGTALAEVYDNTPTAAYTLATPRLINLSAKNQIVAGGSMTAGFVVGGATSKTVLIRATGPALALLGVGGTIPDPQLALHTTINGRDTVLAANAGWGGDPQITTASNSVFAFPLTNPASNDSVVLVTLAPGSYTAVASSVSGAAGTVLIEVYEVP